VTVALAVTLVGIGFFGAFFAGFLGIGGALVMFPLLLYVPPLLGVGALAVREVVGVTMALVFVTAVSGFLAHRRHGGVNRQLTALGGVAATLGSFAGALASRWTDEHWLLVVYALMATAGAILILLPAASKILWVAAAGCDSTRRASCSWPVVSGPRRASWAPEAPSCWCRCWSSW
jgi:uncharacterized membrane protein YfcA